VRSRQSRERIQNCVSCSLVRPTSARCREAPASRTASCAHPHRIRHLVLLSSEIDPKRSNWRCHASSAMMRCGARQGCPHHFRARTQSTDRHSRQQESTCHERNRRRSYCGFASCGDPFTRPSEPTGWFGRDLSFSCVAENLRAALFLPVIVAQKLLGIATRVGAAMAR
jgi:hypothetical protein